MGTFAGYVRRFRKRWPAMLDHWSRPRNWRRHEELRRRRIAAARRREREGG